MHPIDHAASEFNLYIDVQLARKLHRKAGYPHHHAPRA